MQEEQKISVPVAIVVASIIVALAIIYTNRNGSLIPKKDSGELELAGETSQKKLADNLKPVSAKDHILGNPNAPVKIVEFSDIECPFCKSFHPTMKRIVDTYGKEGQVAWVYRHFPLQIHPKAVPEAYATECATEQGGNDIFWKYLDKMFEMSASNNQTDPAVMSQVAKSLGLDVQKFESCLNSGRYEALVNESIEDGLAAGVSGTPHSIVIGKDGKKYPINGALPYETIRQTVDVALGK